MEKTFAMVKPDGVQRNLIGDIIGRIEKKGYKIVALKMLQLTNAMAEEHYKEHIGKPFYQELVDFITSGPVIAMVIEGNDAVKGMRQIIGATKPLEAVPGSIRGDYGINVGHNIIHGADSVESAKREMKIYFTDAELISYTKVSDTWL